MKHSFFSLVLGLAIAAFAYKPYSSYLDVPGVTSEEIEAIEGIKSKKKSFVYGTLSSTESFLDKNGNFNGFSLLFCEWLTDLFGIKFVPQLYEWSDLLDKLETGDVDFSGELTSNEERRKIYYMTNSIAERPLVIMRVKDAEPFEAIEKQRALRIAFLEGTVTFDEIMDLVAYESVETVFTEDYEEAYKKLKSGEIDAFFGEKPAEAAFDIYSDVNVEDFSPPIYSSVSLSTQNAEYKPIISVAQKMLRNNGRRHITEMYNKGYNEYLKHKFYLSLSDEERKYIENNPSVPFAAEISNYPISFYNQHEKKWQGIAIDVLDIVYSLTGMKFEIANDEKTEFADLVKMLERGDVSILSELIHSESRTGKFLWPSLDFMVDRYALISKEDFHDINANEIAYIRTGLAHGTAYTEAFRKWFPDHSSSVEYESLDLAFDALEKGEVEMVMSSLHQFLKITNYFELIGYKTNYIFDYTYKSSFGINKDQELLCSILDKALRLINIKNISDRWMYKTYDYRVKMANAKIPWIIGAFILLAIIIIVLIMFKFKHDEGQRLAGIAQTRTAEVFAIYSSIPDIIFTMNTNLIYTSCNPSFEKFSGRNIEDIIGKGDDDVFGSGKEMTERFTRVNKQVLEEVESVIVQEMVVDSEGHQRFMETIKTPLFQSNELSGLIAISRDITAHKQAEQEAWEASRAKSVFLANMSHEIRTPMNAIIGMTELLEHENLSENQMNYIRDIDVSAHSLLSIINDILDMSKIESGKITLIPVDYDLYALLDNIKSMFQFVARKKSLAFKMEIEEGVPTYLFGDDIRLRQVLTNICGNAVKFTEKGYVKLKASASDDNIVFEISDTGMGIRKEDIPKLFSAFSQADTIKNRGIVGTGLGLSICKTFVEMMGGSVIVDSEYGKGTIFTIAIPFMEGNKYRIEHPEHKKEGGFEAPSADILVVDDNEFNLKVASGLLNLLKIKAKTAHSGKDAIEQVQNSKFDIVFMDHMMPEMDGIEAVAKIRELGGEYEKLPIIALTANAVQGAKEMFLASGFNGFLSKPIEMKEMGKVLREFLPQDKIIEQASEQEKAAGGEEKQLSFIAMLKKIDGINTEIAMEHFSDMEDIYRETFELFYRNLAKQCDDMSGQLSGGDLRGFSIAVHAMKSALATVGAMGLSKKALELEMASKNGEEAFCQENYPDLKANLLALRDSLSAVFPEAEPAKKKPADAAALSEGLEKALKAAKDFDNYAGVETINNLLSYDFEENIRTSLESAAKSFNELDFDGAEENLSKLKS